MSSPSEFSKKSEHQKVWDLLPWFINRSLDATEQAIVENHIKTCVTCRIELNQQQQIYSTLQQADLLQQVSKASFSQLKKRIKTEPAVTLVKGQKENEKPWKFSFPFPNWVQNAAFAAVLLLLISPLVFYSWLEQPAIGGEYRTLAQSIDPGQFNRKSKVIRVIFADEADKDQIKTVMDSLAGYKIDGPYVNGIYEVHINSEQANAHTITEVITQLRNDTSVFFAELAHEPLSTNQAIQ